MKNPILYLFIFCSFNLFSQKIEEKIVLNSISENEIQLSSIDTPLTPIAGAPEPFYTYWWEFGDGHYSTEDFPTHTYSKDGSHEILLARTNNYNDGKGRPKKKKTFQSTGSTLASLDNNEPYLSSNENLSINKNQDPKPDEEIVFAQTYKNTSGDTQKGTLLFFYNEKTFGNKHFIFQEYRRHHKEVRVDVQKVTILKQIDELDGDLSSFLLNNSDYFIGNSNILKTSNSFGKEETNTVSSFNNSAKLKKEVNAAFETYHDVLAWNFDDIHSEEERNLFLSFKTTQEMLTDTNVSISIQSIFIPNVLKYATSVKEIMPIVTAHDPNKLIVSKSKTYRGFSKNKPLEYEIKFQNVGKGPAEEVKLRFYNNAEIDIKNLEIIDFEPKCDFCKENCTGSYFDTIVTKEYVEFFFHNIYLPGTRQKDLESRKASKGFVKFGINTKKKVKQKNLTCRTEIYFDKEDPIKTNNAKTVFQKRLYVGVEVGINYLPISFPKYDVFLRGSMTYRLTNNWYYRAEVGAKYVPTDILENIRSLDTSFATNSFGYDTIDEFGIQHIIAPEDSLYRSFHTQIVNSDIIIKKQNVQLTIVPLAVRRDLNKFLSLGFGIQSTINLVSYSSIEKVQKIAYYDADIQENLALIFGPPLPAGGNPYYVVDYSVTQPIINETNTTSSSETEQYKTYDFDISSGLFLDINVGRIYSFPYLGIRAKVDYNFMNTKVNPALQFYIGANF
ncbi:MAG: hypothetical protein ACI8ZX_001814 [Planctomycetota bacterium]|jgi:hypothetical protein